MNRALSQYIASPEDRREYRKWARRVAAIYGALAVVGIAFAITHHAGAGSRAGLQAAAPSAWQMVERGETHLCLLSRPDGSPRDAPQLVPQSHISNSIKPDRSARCE